MVVENKLGAGGTLAARLCRQGSARRLHLLIHHNGMATAPALYRKLPYNPLTDFEYVGQVVDVPMTLLGRKDLPAEQRAELIALPEGERRQGQPRARRPRRGVAPVRHGVPQAVGVELHDRAVPGHRAGA